MKLKPIEEQVVVLVGATSGIGREAALQFASRGAKVVLSGRSQADLDELVDIITSQGGEATAYAADVADYAQVKGIADHAAQTFGRIDTWVHLAAVALYSYFDDMEPDEFKRVIDVNLLGQMYGAKAALPYLKREGRGALIHVSSVAGRRSLPLQSAYVASKFGVRGFAESLRTEIMEEGLPISVTVVMPSSINTPLFSKARTHLGVKPAPIPPVYEPEVAARTILYAAEHPVREIYAGGSGKSFGVMQKVIPAMMDKSLSAYGYELQTTDEPKGENAPNNLFQHVEGYDTIRGEFGFMAFPSSPYTWLQTHPLVKWALYGVAFAGIVGSAIVSGRTIAQRRRARRSLIGRLRHFNNTVIRPSGRKSLRKIPAIQAVSRAIRQS